MIPHILTLFEFISIPYENQHQTLNIKKIDRGQIKCREYPITLLQPKVFSSQRILRVIKNVLQINEPSSDKSQIHDISYIQYISQTISDMQWNTAKYEPINSNNASSPLD